MSNLELRRRLQEITAQYTGWQVHRQVIAVDDLRDQLPHSVTLVQEAVISDPRTFDFNCHAFTFGLHDLEDFWTIRHTSPLVWPTGRFVCDRLLTTMMEIEASAARPGDLVLYFDAQRLAHSGRIVDQSIESKWGTAHRWRHPALEVPLSFGHQLRWFRAPDLPTVAAAYLELAAAA